VEEESAKRNFPSTWSGSHHAARRGFSGPAAHCPPRHNWQQQGAGVFHPCRRKGQAPRSPRPSIRSESGIWGIPIYSKRTELVMRKIGLISTAAIIIAALYSQTGFSRTVFLTCKTEDSSGTTTEIPYRIDYDERAVFVGSSRFPAQITDTIIYFRGAVFGIGDDTQVWINRLTFDYTIADPDGKTRPSHGHCR
jgi:hypothetical protein